MSPAGPARRSEWSWRLREVARARMPGLVVLYRRRFAALLARDKRHPRFSRWAATGTALRAELGTPEIAFDASGIWIRDDDGLEWGYRPDLWLSALGKELGARFDVAELAWLRRALPQGGTFVDVGAHVGGYALPVARHRPDATIYAFEPVPATRRLLERNLERNGLAATVWPYAVGREDGVRAITTAWGGENHLVTAGAAPAASVEVDVVTLDGLLLARTERVDVVKLDLEGGELDALHGAGALLERDQPDLIVELDPRAGTRGGRQPGEVADHLAGLGYRALDFGTEAPLGAPELAARLAAGGNFLFRRRPS